MKSLTIIIPIYNEEQIISDTLSLLLPVCDEHNWKVLCINDGSLDSTRVILNDFTRVEVIDHPYNKGYGAALKTGIRHAQTDFVAFYDADGQHKPEDLVMLSKEIGLNDMIVGKRSKDSHQEWIRKPGKWILSRVANFLSNRKIPDLNSGLRIVRREIIYKLIPLFPNGFSFSTTSTIAFFNLGYNLVYAPIKTNRRVGKSTVKQIRHGSSTILLILRLIVLFNPLKVFIPVSIITLLIGIVYEIIYGIILIPGIKFLPTSLLTVLIGIMLFFFGLVVDQVSELRKQSIMN